MIAKLMPSTSTASNFSESETITVKFEDAIESSGLTNFYESLYPGDDRQYMYHPAGYPCIVGLTMAHFNRTTVKISRFLNG